MIASSSIDLKAPMAIAIAFRSSQYQTDGVFTLYYWNGEFYKWLVTSYAHNHSDAIRSEIYLFLASRTTVEGGRVNPKKKLVDEVIDALKAISLINIVQLPCWLGSPIGVNADDIIACRNGLLIASSRVLLPHTPAFFNLESVNINFTADAVPKKWLEFLNTLWGDDEAIRSLQDWCGLYLTSDTKFQKTLFIIGPKRAGKGTIAKIIADLGGQKYCCSPTLASLGQHFGLAHLINKRLAIISDARLSKRSDIAAITENILRITGEDGVSIPRKHQIDWQGKLSVKFLFLANELPIFDDSSGALAGRFIILKLLKSFAGIEDLELLNSLRSELSGILNWALDGLDNLNKTGKLHQPLTGQDTSNLFKTITSPVCDFVDEMCYLGAEAEIPCAELYSLWKSWAETNGYSFKTTQMFGKDIASAYPQVDTHQIRDGIRRYNVYRGISTAKSCQPSAQTSLSNINNEQLTYHVE